LERALDQRVAGEVGFDHRRHDLEDVDVVLL
jgi:hypothetical protein